MMCFKCVHSIVRTVWDGVLENDVVHCELDNIQVPRQMRSCSRYKEVFVPDLSRIADWKGKTAQEIIDLEKAKAYAKAEIFKTLEDEYPKCFSPSPPPPEFVMPSILEVDRETLEKINPRTLPEILKEMDKKKGWPKGKPRGKRK
jgi:hypothetical protein